jgi:hypothetical protein
VVEQIGRPRHGVRREERKASDYGLTCFDILAGVLKDEPRLRGWEVGALDNEEALTVISRRDRARL